MSSRLARVASFGLLMSALLGLTACTTNGQPAPRPNSDAAGTGNCTGKGTYTVSTSAVGPIPGLPQSALGPGHTPRIGLVGTKADAAVPTVSLMVWAEEPATSGDETFKDLAIDTEITLSGYTVKVTSICGNSARLDLVSQED